MIFANFFLWEIGRTAQTDLRAAAKLDPPAAPATALAAPAPVVATVDDGCTVAVERIFAEEAEDVGVVVEVIDGGAVGGAGDGGGGIAPPAGSIC